MDWCFNHSWEGGIWSRPASPIIDRPSSRAWLLKVFLYIYTHCAARLLLLEKSTLHITVCTCIQRPPHSILRCFSFHPCKLRFPKLRIRLATVPLVGIILAGAAMEALTILRIYRTCIFKAFVGLEASQDFYMLTATQGVRGVSCWCCGCCVSFKNTIVVLYV